MLKLISLFFSVIILASCATHQNLIAPIQQEIVQGRCPQAVASLQPLAEKPSDDQLLYLLEYGSALQICQQYSLSNEALLKANQLSEEIDFVSLSRSVGATLFNEQMLQYKGDKFEKLFINALAALNFLELDQLDSAMVEVRRINEKTKKYSNENSKSFELNSFANYLSGLVYELDKKYDDACISYKDSYMLDSTYRNVALDMLTACWRAQRFQEFSALVKKINASDEEISYAKQSLKNNKEIIILFMQGWGPKKATRHDDVVYPILRPTLSLTQKLIVTTDAEVDSQIKISEPIYSVEKAAIATLEDDYSALGARRIGARVAKEVVADQIRQKDKAMGDLAWLIMVASERADLRNWSLLPQTIHVVRLKVNNVKSLNLIGQGYDGKTTEDLGIIDLDLYPNKKVFLVKSLK